MCSIEKCGVVQNLVSVLSFPTFEDAFVVSVSFFFIFGKQSRRRNYDAIRGLGFCQVFFMGDGAIWVYE